MDRLIWAAWRAFWVGLGASAVLIGQSLLEAPRAASVPAPPAVELAPPRAPDVVNDRVRSADPILSRNPFDSTRGKLVARVRGQS